LAPSVRQRQQRLAKRQAATVPIECRARTLAINPTKELTMPRPRQRVRLEDGLKLDLNKLIRQNLVRPGVEWGSTIRWTYRNSGEEIASGRVSADMTHNARGWLRLQLGSLDQWINLEAVQRHFGGRQWYFLCPRTGRRASVLWKPPGAPSFASRQAWGRQVAYGSQFETPHDRALSAAQDIRYRLAGAEYISLLDRISAPKPKWMRWRTYEKMSRRCLRQEAICDQYLDRLLGRLKMRR
jgi:hypothetical protein